MSIRTRIEDAMIQFGIGRPEGALLSVLTAISATSRRRRPLGIPSTRRAGNEMGDREAFELFLQDEMVRICGIQNVHVQFRGKMRRIEEVFYKWFRCELTHEGGLPQDVHFDPDPNADTVRIAIDDTGITMTHGWLDGLANSVIFVPENNDLFGSPPKPPVPIDLPKIGLTVGTLAEQIEKEVDAGGKVEAGK